LGRKNFTENKLLVVIIVVLVVFANFTIISSFYLLKNQQEYLITKNDLIENYRQKSLMEPKGETIDIEFGDQILEDLLFENIVYCKTMFDYMGLEQIQRDLIDGISGFDSRNNKGICVAVVDTLVDFKHNNLKRVIIEDDGDDKITNWINPAVTKVVLINNEELEGVNAYFELENLADKNPYSYTKSYFNNRLSLRDYMGETLDSWGHGTNVAGIVNQVAPGAEIISVAMPHCSTTDQLYNVVVNLLTFLEDKKDLYSIKIVNLSMAWQSESLVLDQDMKEYIETKIHDLLTCEDATKLFWVNAAGNTEATENNNWNIVYPSHLSDNWEGEFADTIPNDGALIVGKEDYNSDPAIATGFVSVGSVYALGYRCGLRSNEYVYDNDMDNTGDLKLMAPGFFLRTTSNHEKLNGEDEDTDQKYFTGTSAAAPIVSGLAALIRSVSYLQGYQLEKEITENAVYDSHVNLGSQERLQKYGHGMINPLETLKSYDGQIFKKLIYILQILPT